MLKAGRIRLKLTNQLSFMRAHTGGHMYMRSPASRRIRVPCTRVRSIRYVYVRGVGSEIWAVDDRLQVCLSCQY